MICTVWCCVMWDGIHVYDWTGWFDVVWYDLAIGLS